MAVNDKRWSLGEKITDIALNLMADDIVNSTDDIHPQYADSGIKETSAQSYAAYLYTDGDPSPDIYYAKTGFSLPSFSNCYIVSGDKTWPTGGSAQTWTQNGSYGTHKSFSRLTSSLITLSAIRVSFSYTGSGKESYHPYYRVYIDIYRNGAIYNQDSIQVGNGTASYNVLTTTTSPLSTDEWLVHVYLKLETVVGFDSTTNIRTYYASFDTLSIIPAWG